jgi:hypothetical protein
MSAQDQARALMMRHHHRIKNRQQAMLGRTLSEAGMPSEVSESWNSIQGKPYSASELSYDRSRSALS